VTRDEAIAALNAYRDARTGLHPAVLAARDHKLTQQQIADESGLTRQGVQKILGRQEIPMVTVITDATAVALQVNVQDLYPGQIAPGIGGGIYPEVTLPADKADQLIATLTDKGYKAWL
jgi:transcriptional regulator with XRE-family HTH domain